MRLSWTAASRRHGISRSAARFVIEHCGLVLVQPAPPGSPVPTVRLVYLGDDDKGRALEVVGVEMEPGHVGEEHIRIIHAMALREKYRSGYEEAKKWRV